MRYSVIILAIILCSSFAIKPKKISKVQEQRIAEIKKGSSWGKILLNLAELQAMSKGPLEDLIQAIEDTVTDLQDKKVKRDEAYEKRTDEHNALVSKLTSDIANAEQDIADIISLLENLAEQKATLEEENRALTSTIKDTKSSIVDATKVREAQHEEYLSKVIETEEAVETVEECLNILNEFYTGGASLVQVQKAKHTLDKAQKKLKNVHFVESSFLSALIQVATNQEFADQGAVLKVIDKFQEIKNNLLDSSSKLAADEESYQNEFNKFVADGQETIMESENSIEYNNGLLVENQKNTEENTALKFQRIADKKAFEEELDDENESYADYVDIYTKWCEENAREIEVCQEALAVVSTVNFDDYIGDRVNADDGLVSSGMSTAKQHGQGGEVFKFDYDQF